MEKISFEDFYSDFRRCFPNTLNINTLNIFTIIEVLYNAVDFYIDYDNENILIWRWHYEKRINNDNTWLYGSTERK